jgi:phosphatidylserine decarboxylase
MTIHREGTRTILFSFVLLFIIDQVLHRFLPTSLSWVIILFRIVSSLFWLFIVSFFRIPKRKLTLDDTAIVSPCDGKVVVIEEVIDPEYFKDKRLQVSIFMSPANVHVNRNPLSGEVVYNQYHPGKYLVAWDPKSSTENERHSVVIKHGNTPVLVKQIAGAVARRIVNYLSVGQTVKQGNELGFIKFGSRVDLLLPPGTKVEATLNQVVKGGVSVIARI